MLDKGGKNGAYREAAKLSSSIDFSDVKSLFGAASVKT